jgi:hypothetical protein
MTGTVPRRRFTIILLSLQIFRRGGDQTVANTLKETGDECDRGIELEWRE